MVRDWTAALMNSCRLFGSSGLALNCLCSESSCIKKKEKKKNLSAVNIYERVAFVLPGLPL